eukprot:2033639-Rhodomonas_salina.1
MVLRAWYGVSGTVVAYGAMQCPVCCYGAEKACGRPALQRLSGTSMATPIAAGAAALARQYFRGQPRYLPTRAQLECGTETANGTTRCAVLR